ncbi:outer membrane lipoprotein chaperone LolA [Marinomonas ostreistagni]|uniref:outer membrane lipoprotein chaperone LolA n=1 Tax=Marinomonas ostreistagni TaxID=359209 RepID=UPI00195289EF|nr:outer membrane lipoprotein chaperone LolA [Marinomonas ostreistagni]MBM6549584.1 outer membrane lipoprotein chaperone LolA [Marinomonas ostreistagni]
MGSVKVVRQCVGLLLALLSVSVWADGEQALSKLLDQNRNVEGEFRQTTYNEQGDEVQASSGVFLLAAPNRFVWDTVAPFPQRIVSDGEWVTIWDVDLEQATRKPIAGTLGESPAALLGESSDKVIAHYQVSELSGEKYRLKPQGEEDMFDTLTLAFDDGEISAMSIRDVLGQTTVIEFASIEAHEGVSEENFVVDLPDSVDVIVEQ